MKLRDHLHLRRSLPLLLGLVLLLFLSLPFLVHLGRPLLDGAQFFRASQRVNQCLYARGDPADCYRKVLRPLARTRDYPRILSLCTSTKDPLCYQAYGELLPNPSLCALARKDGTFALWACHTGWFATH